MSVKFKSCSINLAAAVAMAGIYLILFWPGILSPDSMGQFEQAKSGVFTNHHPALMTFIWSLFHKVLPGSGLFLTAHVLLWCACLYVLCDTLLQKNATYSYAVYLLAGWPTFLGYTPMIWKDVSFSLSYFLSICLIARALLLDKKLSIPSTVSLLVLLFYGTGVKYQAVYVLPVVVFYLTQTSQLFKSCQKAVQVFFTLVLTVAFFQGNKLVDSYLVPPQQQSNSWQMARLYDLAGISYFAYKPLVPDYIKQGEGYSAKKLFSFYNSKNVDPYIYAQKPTFKTTQNKQELDSLWTYWKETVYHYPFEYFLHRSYLWLNLISQKPRDIVYYLETATQTLTLKTYTLTGLKAYMAFFPLWVLNFFWVFPLLVLSCFLRNSLGVNNGLKKVINLFQGVIFSQLFIYFFLSMASDFRYVYLSMLSAGALLIMLFFAGTIKKQCEY